MKEEQGGVSALWGFNRRSHSLIMFQSVEGIRWAVKAGIAPICVSMCIFRSVCACAMHITKTLTVRCPLSSLLMSKVFIYSDADRLDVRYQPEAAFHKGAASLGVFQTMMDLRGYKPSEHCLDLGVTLNSALLLQP